MNKPKSRIENIVVQEMNKELLIYDLKDNKAFCLNETSAIIYQLCDGKRTIVDINRLAAKRLNQPVNEELIWLALDGLKKEGLLENSDIEIDFNGMNRRQIIRKVGLASLIALPIVSSIVAPSAALAQSSCQSLNQSCTFNNWSQSNCCSGLRCVGASFCRNCIPPGSNFAIGCFQPDCNCSSQPIQFCCNSSAPFTAAPFVCRCG